ncbi:hypothetical protein DFH06DRAFT_1214027 [Mycena polygramma]|nr:hypothetical protein DFH06DRAFT_1214027 [Mycena polygramma]
MPPKYKRTAALASTPQEQCLRNSDLLDQILCLLNTPTLPALAHDYQAEKERHVIRKTLLSATLTSRAIYHSAVKILWRRLENLLPLIRLLPSFEYRSGHYSVAGFVGDAEWTGFDRHAAYVREIIYSKTFSGTINPLVYMRLAMRKSILLPNLSRFDCVSDRSGADILLYASPSLASVSLGSPSPSDAEAFLNVLSAQDPRLSHVGKIPVWSERHSTGAKVFYGQNVFVAWDS